MKTENMKALLDVNVWLPLAWDGHAASTVARDWLNSHKGCLIFCRITQLALLRYLTNPNILGADCLSNRDAAVLIEALVQQPNVTVAAEPPDLAEFFPRLGETRNSNRNLWTDAYLAAFAIGGAFELVTSDRGFTRFKSRGLSLRLLKAPV